MERSQYLAAALDQIGKPPSTVSQPQQSPMNPAMMQQILSGLGGGGGMPNGMGGSPGGISLSSAPPSQGLTGVQPMQQAQPQGGGGMFGQLINRLHPQQPGMGAAPMQQPMMQGGPAQGGILGRAVGGLMSPGQHASPLMEMIRRIGQHGR